MERKIKMFKKIFSLILLFIFLGTMASCSGGGGAGGGELPPAVSPGGSSLPGIPGLGGGTGTIEGRVIDYETAEAIENADVMVDSGQTAKTDQDGAFTLTGVWEGGRLLVANKTGYELLPMSVTVNKDEVTNVTISLRELEMPELPNPTPTPTPTEPEPEPEPATLIVKAYSDVTDEDNFVTRIEVTDEDDFNYDWDEEWLSHDYYRELYCNEATIGHHYNITVYWNGGVEYTRDWIELYQDEQVEIIYPPEYKKKL